MSSIPTVVDLATVLCWRPPDMRNLSDKETITLIQTNSATTTKLVKRQLARARKARVRLRQQNKLRATAVRNN